MTGRAHSVKRILLGVALATIAWEALMASVASSYLLQYCFGWCWPVRFLYAVPLLLLPVVAARRVGPPAERIFVAVLALLVAVVAAYVTFLAAWIFEFRDTFDPRSLRVMAVDVLPELLALPIIFGLVVVTVIAAHATHRSPRPPVEDVAPGADSEERTR